MPKQRIAIVGAGNMARARGRALLGHRPGGNLRRRRPTHPARCKLRGLSWDATFSAMTFAGWRRPHQTRS